MWASIGQSKQACAYCGSGLCCLTHFVLARVAIWIGASQRRYVDDPGHKIVVSALARCCVAHCNECQQNIVACWSKAPKFTLSRKQRTDERGVAGIGWTESGMNKFNKIYDSVKEDRISRGATFNIELLNVFLECKWVVKTNPHRANSQKRKMIPRDDMVSIDTAGADGGYDECVPLQNYSSIIVVEHKRVENKQQRIHIWSRITITSVHNTNSWTRILHNCTIT